MGRSSKASENGGRNNEKRRTGRTSDGSAGSVRCRTVQQEQKARKIKKREMGLQMPTFDKARARGFYLQD